MKFWQRLGVVIAAVLVLALGPRVWHHFNAQRMLHTGDRLAPLALASLSGQAYTLAPRGHAQILNVFATWCSPCRAETPALAAVAPRLRARGVEVVGIDQQESPEAVANFVKQFGLPYKVYVDEGDATHDVLGARVIPTTIYVDASGTIRWMHAGPISAVDFDRIARSIISRV